jgi:hypothetical protein
VYREQYDVYATTTKTLENNDCGTGIIKSTKNAESCCKSACFVRIWIKNVDCIDSLMIFFSRKRREMGRERTVARRKFRFLRAMKKRERNEFFLCGRLDNSDVKMCELFFKSGTGESLSHCCATPTISTFDDDDKGARTTGLEAPT